MRARDRGGAGGPRAEARAVRASWPSSAAPEAILATNTSSLSVTAIAAGVEQPERVVRHALLQPAGADAPGGGGRRRRTSRGGRWRRPPRSRGRWAASRSAPPTRSASSPTAAPGPSRSRRCGCSASGVADARPDRPRSAASAAAFAWGRSSSWTWSGVDVNFEVAKSFWEQSFHEPRWQPHPIQARMVAAGRLGRKAGRGYYDYGGGRAPPRRSRAARCVRRGRLGGRSRGGLRPRLPGPAPGERQPRRAGSGRGRCRVHGAARSGSAALVELPARRRPATRPPRRPSRYFAARGKHVEWVGDAPGLVLGRILAQIVNEAHFAVGAGRRERRGHRHRDAARLQLAPRAVRVGRGDRPQRSSRSSPCSTRSGRGAPAMRSCYRASRLGGRRGLRSPGSSRGADEPPTIGRGRPRSPAVELAPAARCVTLRVSPA